MANSLGPELSQTLIPGIIYDQWLQNLTIGSIEGMSLREWFQQNVSQVSENYFFLINHYFFQLETFGKFFHFI